MLTQGIIYSGKRGVLPIFVTNMCIGTTNGKFPINKYRSTASFDAPGHDSYVSFHSF